MSACSRVSPLKITKGLEPPYHRHRRIQCGGRGKSSEADISGQFFNPGKYMKRDNGVELGRFLGFTLFLLPGSNVAALLEHSMLNHPPT